MSEPESNALLFPSAFLLSHNAHLVGCHIQLHAESSTEDGEQHGSVAAEYRAAVDG